MRRNQFALTWWGNIWIKTIENMGSEWENRLPRGRRYARGGRVVECKVLPGEITAKVSGTRRRPYDVHIKFRQFSNEEKVRLFALFKERPLLVSSILNMNLPEDIVNILKNKNIKLLPSSEEEIHTYCSCPDWANPCKHIAAVFYVLAQVIDSDPLTIFTLRGIPKEKFLEQLKLISHEREVERFFPSNEKSTDLYLRRKDNPYPPLDFEGDGKHFIFSMLTDNPIFYRNGNLKEILRDIYNSMGLDFLSEKHQDFSHLQQAKGVIYLEEKNSLFFYEFPDKAYKNKRIELLTIKNKTPVKKRFHGTLISLEEILPYLIETSLLTEEEVPDALFTYIYLAHFALSLVEKSYFVPYVYETTTKNRKYCGIRYRAYLIRKDLKETMNSVLNGAPLCTFLRKKGKHYLSSHDVLNAFLNSCINLLVKSGIHKSVEGEYISYFKRSDPAVINDPFVESFFSALKAWLAPLYLREKEDVVKLGFLLKPASTGKKWFLHPLVFPQDSKPESLKSFWQQTDDNKRSNILEIFSILIRHIPLLGKLENKRGGFKKRIDIGPKDLLNFLTDARKYLELFDIPLILPEEIKEISRIKPRAVASASSSIDPMLSLENILSFKWQVAMGDTVLSKEEFLKLCESKSPLIHFKETWFLVKPEELERVKRILERELKIKDYSELIRSSLAGEVETEDGVVEFVPPEEINETLKSLVSIRKSLEAPPDLKAQLRPYQLIGYRWLITNAEAGFGCCLADDMGLGKTVQTIAAILYLNKKGIKPVLVVVPTTVLGNWEKEINKFAPSLKVFIYHGANRNPQCAKNVDIILTTYGLLRQKNNSLLRKKFMAVVIDEAQNIKNPAAAQTKAVYKLSKIPYRFALSGTPIENRLMELWSIFNFLNPGLLGSMSYFQKHFSTPIERYGNRHARERLKRIIAPFILKRDKKDRTIIKDLPEKIEKNEYCSLTPEQASLYQQLVKTAMKSISGEEGIHRKGLILKLLLGLKQICNHPGLYLKRKGTKVEESGKMMRLFELLHEINHNNEKVLIFSQFKEMGEILKSLILKEMGEDVLFLHGGTPRKKRDRLVEEFLNEEKPWIFILSLKAGGTGLNLVSANHVIHYDLWWNPAVEDQASDRAYRIGQVNNVYVHRLITRGTIEDKIEQILETKRELSASIITSGEAWITELSDDELMELIKLDE